MGFDKPLCGNLSYVCLGCVSYFARGWFFLETCLGMLFSGSYLLGGVDFGNFFDLRALVNGPIESVPLVWWLGG